MVRGAGGARSALCTRLCDAPASYPSLLAATLITVPLAVYALLSAVFGDGLRRPTRAFLSCALVALHWDGPIHLWDSYYWLTGAIENRLCLSLGLFTLAGLLRSGRAEKPVPYAVEGLAVLAILTTGMHQLYGAYLVVVLLVGTVVAYRAGIPGRRDWIIVTIAAVIGLSVNVFAPGNAVRLAFEKPHHELWWFKALLNWWVGLAGEWLMDVRLWLATFLIVCHPGAAGAAPKWLRARPTTVFAAATAAIVGHILTG